MTEVLSFFVHGVPVPQGSKKIVPTRRGFRLIDVKPDALTEWRAAVGKVARIEMGPRAVIPLGEPLMVDATFYLPRPPSNRSQYPTGKPDGDKLYRAVGDALTGVVYADDAQVIDPLPHKRWATSVSEVGVRIVVSTPD